MRNTALKKEQVREKILYRILSGEYAIDGRVPPERELCDIMKVSRITIRAAVDDLVNEGVLERDGRRGTLIKKIPETRNAFSENRKQLLFVYFSSIKGHPVEKYGASSMLYHGIESFANNYGYGVMVQSGENFLRQSAKQFGSVAGIITGGSQLENRLPSIMDIGVPVVAADVLIYNWPVDSICGDNYEAGIKAAGKIAERKCKKPLFLILRYESEDFIQPCFLARRSGFMDFQCGNGVEKCQHIVDYKDIFNNGKSIKKLYSLIKEKKIDSIVDCSDLINSYLPDFNKICRLPTIILGGVSEVPDKRKNIDLLFFDIECIGYLAAERLHERIQNPCLEPIRYLVPVKDKIR